MTKNFTQIIKKRRSHAKLQTPAPSEAILNEAFACALKAPDHRLLRPWRYIVIGEQQRQALADLFLQASLNENPDLTEVEREKIQKMPFRAPMIVLAILSPKDDEKVPEHEQYLSLGAGVQNFLLALEAQGFGSIWRTGALTHNAHVKAAFHLQAREEILGFIYIGTPVAELKELPMLCVEDYVSSWKI
jgi:nitroreductase